MGNAFKSIKPGLMEAIAHASGQVTTATVHPPQPIDVKAIRMRVDMTQLGFAARPVMVLAELGVEDQEALR